MKSSSTEETTYPAEYLPELDYWKNGAPGEIRTPGPQIRSPYAQLLTMFWKGNKFFVICVLT
jgi:hypothetical protein